MRLLWLLPKAAPALLRHLAAYVELAAYDLAQSQRDIIANILVSVIVALALFFAVLMGCAVIVALTWDTSHRVAAIAWMGGGFLAIAVIGLIYLFKTIKQQKPFLASVRGEWQQDAVIFERILSEERSEHEASQ
jgi:uncharacterized membrane protein YqjE